VSLRGYQAGALITAIAYGAFISLGLPDAVTGVAWPSLQADFGIPTGYFGLVLAGLCGGYFTSGILAGRMIHSLGIAGLLSLSCLLVSIAMAMNSAITVWWLLIINALLWGLGSGAIDSGLNAYAAHHFPAKHMHWMHACYSLGAALGPLAMSFAIVQLHSWRYGYLIVSATMAVMMLVFYSTRKHWEDDSAANPAHTGAGLEASSDHSFDRESSLMTTARALRNPLVWFHIVAFFLYTGFEALVGQWSFTWLTQGRQIEVKTAGFWVSAYFFAIGGGRIVTGTIVGRLGLDRLIRLSMGTAFAGTLLMAFSPSNAVSCASLMVIGVGLAAIFPCLMSRTPQRLGQQTAAHAIGFQIAAATLGAATIPGITGVAIERLGVDIIATAAVCVAVCLMVVHESLLMTTRSQQAH
jgi:fucose permease